MAMEEERQQELKSFSSPEIRRIEQAAVHDICSGQVVTDLRSAVKELLENAVDAGASCVEVHLHDCGTTAIEVVDNGSGIAEDNFEVVGLQHHTSKLRQFSDLTAVATFGFRGQALAALAALAQLSVVTRHRAAAVGARLTFSRDGRLSARAPAPRQVGTTVSVRQLFAPLPVRRRQFCAQARRQLTSLVHLLWGYALATPGLRLTCTEQSAGGKKSVLVSAAGGAQLSERVAELFGSRQMATLLPVTSAPPSDVTRAAFGLAASEPAEHVTVTGLVSSCEHGKGRTAKDRQFIAINGRPCDHAKMSRVVNELYRRYSSRQWPMLVLQLSTPAHHLDLNVSPDKRAIYLRHESLLLATVQESLTRCFERVPATFVLTPAATGVPSPVSGAPTVAVEAGGDGDWMKTIKRNVRNNSSPAAPSKRQCLDRFFKVRPPEQPSRSSDTSAASSPSGRPADVLCRSGAAAPAETAGGSAGDCQAGSALSGKREAPAPTEPLTGAEDALPAVSGSGAAVTGTATADPAGAWTDGTGSHRQQGCPDGLGSATHAAAPEVTVVTIADDTADVTIEMSADVTPDVMMGPSADDTPDVTIETSPDATSDNVTIGTSAVDQQRGTMSPKGTAAERRRRRRSRLPLCLDALRRQVAALEVRTSEAEDRGQELRFRAGIVPSENSAAEEELRVQIQKQDFLEMRVLGQFNRGFLVSRLGGQLFIIDQHAADEKWRFERLCAQPPVRQPLLARQELRLPPASEETVLEHRALLADSGFQVEEAEQAEAGRRLRLLTAPAVLGRVLDQSDLEELVWVLQQSAAPPARLRPSRARALLASRACRGAVMVGTCLSPAGMEAVVRNMAGLDDPWSCPHGRPTMRHLVSLERLADQARS